MEIRKIGPLPEDNFLIMPNASIRDRRLSYRARGLMAVISSHVTGFHVSSDDLAEGGAEGVRAIRTAMNELIARGYMRRIRSQDEQGRWRTDIDVYIWGDAPPIIGRERGLPSEVSEDDFDPQPQVEASPEVSTDGPLPPVGSPDGGFRPAVSAPVREHHLENHSIPSSPAAAAEKMGDLSTEVALGDGAAEKATTRPRDTLPLVLQRRLQNLGVTDGTVWTQAWQAATSLEWPGFAMMEADRFPEEHLMMHLIGREEEGRELSASRWLRFYIADRARRIDVIAGDIERRARMEETPQEREDRYTRRRPPPAAYGSICHGCGCMPATEPHKSDCHVAAKTAAGETGAAS